MPPTGPIRKKNRLHSLHKTSTQLRRPESVERIHAFFSDQPGYLPALLLFQAKTSVPKADIARVSSRAVTILVSHGVIAGQKGGRNFELTPAARALLEARSH